MGESVMNYLIALCLLFSSTVYSYSEEMEEDLVSAENMIVVAKRDDGRVFYRYCEKKYGYSQTCSNYQGSRLCEDIPHENGYNCQTLGGRKYYTEDELDRIASSERTKSYLKAAGSAATVVGIFSLMLATTPVSLPSGAIAIAWTGALFGLPAFTSLAVFGHPTEFWEQGKLLKNPALRTEFDYSATPEEIKKASVLLNNILN
jgi:hypothetical protein